MKLRSFFLPLVCLAGVFSGSMARGADFELVGREMVRILQSEHYARHPFNEELSLRFLERFVASVDPERIYFTEAEVSAFRTRYGRDLHDRISTRSVMPVARGLYQMYQTRVLDRVDFVKALLDQEEIDLEAEIEMVDDRSEAPRPANHVELKELWSQQLQRLLVEEEVRRARLRRRAAHSGRLDPFAQAKSVREVVGQKFERLLRSVQQMGEEEIANAFFSAVTHAYDPHSEYLSANELAQFRIDVSNELVGIGARLEPNDAGEIEIKGIVNDGPADRQGELRLNDRIIAISPANDGFWKSVLYKSIPQVIEDILGQDEVPVGLRIRREVDGADVVLELAIPRGVITMKDELASARVYEDRVDGMLRKWAVLTIPSFYFDFEDSGNRVSVDVEKILKRLKTEKIDGLVLDLRNNPGGSLPEAQRLTGFFIGTGPVVQVKEISGQVKPLNSLNRKPLYEGPLVVLTNRESASATEILAGALQDYRRAVIVGASATYGKGTVQKTMDISNFMPVYADRERAGWLKLTFQKYYRVSGSSVQIRGVTPDLIVPDPSDAREVGEGFRKYALPHDIIRRSAGFRPPKQDQRFLPELRMKSRDRIAADPFLQELARDLEEAAKERERNRVSLSLRVRLAEMEEREKQREEDLVRRREWFAQLEESDRERFTILRLTLDDLKQRPLPAVSSFGQESDYIRLADDEKSEALTWPNGIDGIKREGLQVLRDLVELQSQKR